MDLLLLPERYQKMFSPKGFRELVNTEYQSDLRRDPKALREDTFWRLNDEWHKLIGRYRYNDYPTFTAAERCARKRTKDRANG